MTVPSQNIVSCLAVLLISIKMLNQTSLILLCNLNFNSDEEEKYWKEPEENEGILLKLFLLLGMKVLKREEEA